MNDCEKCRHKYTGCYCPPNKVCTAFEKESRKVKHTFTFETDDDWVPGESACWVGCPFAFMIDWGKHCNCFDNWRNCPFLEGCK